MTLSTRIARTATGLRRVHSELATANRRMFELTTAFPADFPTRPTRDQLPLRGQHIGL